TPLRIVLGALGAVLAWLTRRLVLPVLRAIGAAARGVGRRVAAVWSALAGAAVAALRAVGGAAVAVILLGARGLALLGRSAGRTVRRMVERLVVRPVIALLGLMAAGARLLGRALVAPVALLWRRGLRPAGSAIAIAAVAAVMGAWRFLVRPLARGIGQALGWAWHTSGRVLAFTGRVLAWPFVWLYRHVLTPVGHVLRSAWRAAVLAPWRAVRRTTAGVVAAVRTAVRDARRQAGNQVRSALGRPPR
ncbi:MAG TPA: hypothetical protein VNS46_18225, partial [Nocardioides sp.]|nr:hypothetical protein [Nocardioides sp.]